MDANRKMRTKFYDIGKEWQAVKKRSSPKSSPNAILGRSFCIGGDCRGG